MSLDPKRNLALIAGGSEAQMGSEIAELRRQAERDRRRRGGLFIGQVAASALASAPRGWLTCDGAAVSRTTYAALFALIGTTYGAGNGTTTFNLPDLRDRTAVGVSGSIARGSTGGSKTQESGVVQRSTDGATGFQFPTHFGGQGAAVTRNSFGFGFVTSNSVFPTLVANMPPYIGLHFVIFAGV